MKIIIVGLLSFLSLTCFAKEQDELCGRFYYTDQTSSDSVPTLGLAFTETSFMEYVLVAKTEAEKELIASLAQGEDYCIMGDLSWCSYGAIDRCVTNFKLNNN